MNRFGLLDILLNLLKDLAVIAREKLGGHQVFDTTFHFSHVSLGTSFAPLRGFCGTLQQHFSVTFSSLAP
jgi:hypothetical protein